MPNQEPQTEESLALRDLVIEAVHAAACNCGEEDPRWSTYWQKIADAAIAVIQEES